MTLTLQAVPPMAPLVHMNGSSKQDLIDQQIAIMDAADALLAALRAANPNGRDYYPLGDDALVRAAAEHKARVVQAEALRAEAEALALAIQAQGRGR
jgi:hypothetical protein